MNIIDSKYVYKVANVTKGRQVIKFHKEGPVNDEEVRGTTVEEVVKVLQSKLFLEHPDNLEKRESVLLTALELYLRQII